MVGVRPSLPVDIIMVNNLAGDRVWPDTFSPLVVSSFPLPGPEFFRGNHSMGFDTVHGLFTTKVVL